MRSNSIIGGYRGGSSQGKVCMRSDSIIGLTGRVVTG